MTASVHDLRDAFLTAVRRRTPSDAECVAKLRVGGWTAESAAEYLRIHPGWIKRMERGIHVHAGIRQKFHTLPAISPSNTRTP